MLRRVVLFVLITAVLAGGLWYSQQRPARRIVSGVVEADQIRVGSRVGGRVAAVHVEEGATVAKGTVLVQLEPFDLAARQAEAAAHLAQARATLALLEAGSRREEIAQAEARVAQQQARLEELRNGPRQQEIDTAVAELKLAQSELALAQKRFDRTQSLVEEGATSQDEFERVINELRVAEARVIVTTDALALLREGTRPEAIAQAEAALEVSRQAWELARKGNRPEQIEAARAAVAAAEASQQVTTTQLAELEIVSPIAGIVEAIDLRPGDLVSANAPVVTLIDPQRMWVRAYAPERLLDLQLNDRVPVSLDAWPDERLTGVLTYVSPQAEFTPRNVQTPEERAKQVFRIKIMLSATDRQLRAGMSCDVLLGEATHGP